MPSSYRKNIVLYRKQDDYKNYVLDPTNPPIYGLHVTWQHLRKRKKFKIIKEYYNKVLQLRNFKNKNGHYMSYIPPERVNQEAIDFLNEYKMIIGNVPEHFLNMVWQHDIPVMKYYRSKGKL